MFVVYDRALLTGISLGYEMFHAANAWISSQRHQSVAQQAAMPCRLLLANAGTGAPKITGALPLTVEHSIADIAQADYIFLPPMWRNPLPVVQAMPQFCSWLQHQFQPGATLCATGTGVYFLAQAGLLDGRAATTHWYYFDAFKRRYPQVDLQTQHFITHADRLYCAGSINAQTDLVIFLIEQIYGTSAKHWVETHFSHEVSRTYDAPMYQLGGETHADEAIVAVQAWLQHHWHQPVDLQHMAHHAGLPVRTFSRRFKRATGTTAHQYLQGLRMQAARDLLKTTDMTMQDIAQAVGYPDPAYFSRVFTGCIGLSPSEYRRVVRAKLFRVC